MDKYIGIDISKYAFDVHFHEKNKTQSYKQTDAEIKKFIESLHKIKPTLIVMETTGGYELDLVFELKTSGFPVAVENPRKIRNFARAVGQAAKTDKLDAKIIALYAATLRPPPSLPLMKIF